MLLAALAVGLLRQGGYFASTQWALGLLLTGALLLALTDRPLALADLSRLPVAALLAAACWALLGGAVNGTTADGAGAALLLVGVAAVLVVCHRLADPQRAVAFAALVAVAAAVALSGWAGVAFRVDPWALDAQGLWRASTTLTYPNAAAAALVLVALPVAALLARTPRSPALALALTLLAVGVGATLSRAGLLALAVGGAVLVALVGVRAVAGAVAGPLLGAAVALAGLLPSVPAGRPAAPAVATAALLGGLALGVVLPRLPARAVAALVAAVGLGAAASLAGWPALRSAAGQVVDVRLTADSPDRANGLRAALDVIAGHPLAGAGPGLAEFRWTGPTGVGGMLRYAHNEYLQTVAELGLVGGVLVGAVLVGVARMLWRDRRAPGPLWSGVVAATAALAVHSGFDFVWHVPALPLLAAALTGLATRSSHNGRSATAGQDTLREEESE